MLVINCKVLLGVCKGLAKQVLSAKFFVICYRKPMRFIHNPLDQIFVIDNVF